MVALVIATAAGMFGAGVWWGSASRKPVIDALTGQQIAAQREAQRLDEENQSLATQMEQLQQELGSARQQLDKTYSAVEVGGAVDFPVLRGMARSGDTLKSFAAREGVSVEVIRALNPWLKSDQMALENRQTIWLPKPATPTKAVQAKP